MSEQKWELKKHVESSLPKKEGRFSLFIGRWQILHKGHTSLFDQVLADGGNVCIAIRDVATDERNPLTSKEVRNNLYKEYAGMIIRGRVKVIIIPDIDAVCFGRGVGYDIIEFIPPADIAEISASKIRQNDNRNKG